MDEGSYLPDCRMSAISFSASGLETIATGAYPQAHGIVAESWYDPESKKMVTASAAASQGTTLDDEIVTAESRKRVFVMDADGSRAYLLARRAAVKIVSLQR